MFRFLFQNFRSILDGKVRGTFSNINPSATSHADWQDNGAREISTAIRGYGYLAGPCRSLLGETELKVMFEDIAQRSEQLYLSSEQVCCALSHSAHRFVSRSHPLLRAATRGHCPSAQLHRCHFQYHPRAATGCVLKYSPFLCTGKC